jgi:hypothetical protein
MLAASILLSLSWVSMALAQVVDDDGDGFDGDELFALPIVLGVLAVVGWLALRRRSSSSQR